MAEKICTLKKSGSSGGSKKTLALAAFTTGSGILMTGVDNDGGKYGIQNTTVTTNIGTVHYNNSNYQATVVTNKDCKLYTSVGISDITAGVQKQFGVLNSTAMIQEI